ncbi:hypothetical protein ACP70R_028405 [Stipagrostis hirtigluma subsp. patula]
MASLLHLLLLPCLLATAAAADLAPAPSPSPPMPNLTSILEKGEQYTTLLRLLRSTGVADQLATQLRNSYDGLTLFAPNDNAFTKLPAGALNGLGDQQQVELLLYHVVPRYYSLATFKTASNPLRTEASGPGGVYTVNVTSSTGDDLVNVSTGVAAAVPISSTMFAEFPLAVYSVDDVLRPEQLFGRAGEAASAPAPGQAATAAGTTKKKGAAKNDAAAEPTAAPAPAGEEDDSASAAAGRGSVEWRTAVAFALMAVVNLVGAA